MHLWLRDTQIDPGFDDKHREDRMDMAIVVLTVVEVRGDEPGDVISVPMVIDAVVVVIMVVKHGCGLVIPDVSMQGCSRSPGHLERQQEHQQDGEDSAHGGIVTGCQKN
jgi:hypothetical protein